MLTAVVDACALCTCCSDHIVVLQLFTCEKTMSDIDDDDGQSLTSGQSSYLSSSSESSEDEYEEREDDPSVADNGHTLNG